MGHGGSTGGAFSLTHRDNIQQALLRFWGATRRERVLAKVDQSGGPSACWLWGGSTDVKGYGSVKVRGKRLKAHRVVYELLTGRPLSPSTILLHHCAPNPDNKRCCNPAHLREGTLPENSADAAAKGQMRRGAAHPGAKLTEAQVVAIRKRVAAGEVSSAIAREFGVSTPVLSRIVCGQAWQHAPGPVQAKLGVGLTDDQVREIRHLRARGHRLEDIAADYGVSVGHIGNICTGKARTEVTTLPDEPVVEKAQPLIKLRPDDVEEIARRYASGASQKDLAAAFGVSQAHISRIVRGMVRGGRDAGLVAACDARSRGHKLNAAKVTAIRGAVGAGQRPKDVAAAFGVSERLIRQILARKVWGHVPDVSLSVGS